jgi:RNA polymerase sigma-70 factor (ECF subfamily)
MIALAPTLELAFQPQRCENTAVVSKSTEQELVRRAIEGDGRAFATLVAPHLPMLYRIAARACGSRALAEDAVQEALTLAYERLARYEPGTSLKSFLAAFAVRKSQTMLRSERRRYAREAESEAPAGLGGPADQLGVSRTSERVREALAAMPKKRREVALLRLDGSMSYAEIAEAVGSTEGSARVLVHLAMKELRDKLSDLLPNAEEKDDDARSEQP